MVTLLSILVLMLAAAVGAAPTGYEKGALDQASTHYVALDPSGEKGQERFFCLARGRCHFNTIQCPAECPERKPKKNKVNKGCFADCSSRCETTCKYRKPKCEGYGSVCYDPRFVGGDGVMFYFHGAKGGDFALVSDDHLQINAHFIGFRPKGRARDFTWVQALALMFESHTLVIAATRVTEWNDRFDALTLRWDGKGISVPTDGEGEWRTSTVTTDNSNNNIYADAGSKEGREVVVERTAETNSIRVTVSGLVEINVRVTPIGEAENRTHGYGLPAGDSFAHLETQFKFSSLTGMVEGILGQTYRPDYTSPVKKGVSMPMMGGEDKYRTTSFLSTGCPACRFHHPTRTVADMAQY